METKHLSIIILVALGILTSASPKNIDVTRRPHTNNYLSCNKCFGHGMDPNSDPRCRFGCDRNMTYPPGGHAGSGQTDMTPYPFTITTTTELPPGNDDSIDIDPLDYAWNESSQHKPNLYEGKRSPMMKLIPQIDESMVPLITRQQKEQYDAIIKSIKTLKERESVDSLLGNTMNSLLLIVTLTAMTLMLVVILLLLIMYLAFNEKYSRTSFKASGLSLPKLKMEEV